MQPDSLPSSPPIPKPKPNFVPPLMAFLLLVALGLGYYYYQLLNPDFSLWGKFRSFLPASTSVSPTPTPTEAQRQPVEGVGAAYKLPTGVQTYKFNHGPLVKGPKIQTLVLDPIDPAKGSTQKISLEISSKSELTKATVIVSTDHLNKNINLKFVSGTLEKGFYEGSWQVSDTYTTQYSLHFILTDKSETYDNTMYLR